MTTKSPAMAVNERSSALAIANLIFMRIVSSG
jgi:hypothetical protein